MGSELCQSNAAETVGAVVLEYDLRELVTTLFECGPHAGLGFARLWASHRLLSSRVFVESLMPGAVTAFPGGHGYLQDHVGGR